MIWNWIRDQNNRESLRFIGVAVVAIPVTIFSFINWLGTDEVDNPNIPSIPAIDTVSDSRAKKIETQLRQCLDGNIIECQGLNYKSEEADLRCVNDIRESDPVKVSHAHNDCALIKGTAFQIMALANNIRSNCNDFSSTACVKARQDAKFHDNDTLSNLALYLDKYN